MDSLGQRLAEVPTVVTVRTVLTDLDIQVWLVGGGVRDALLGRTVDDIDLVVDGDPEPVARRLADSVDGYVFQLSEEFGAWRVIARDRTWQADVASCQGGSIEADLTMRDFTVNAIALKMEDLGPPIDPTGGLGDLEAKVLRAVGDSTFRDDPLRLMRLPRLACELDFSPDPTTTARAHEQAALIAEAAGERLFVELRGILISPAAIEGLELMDELGLTAHVLPELEALKGVEQNPYHHLDVYDHTFDVLRQLIALEGDLAPFGEYADAMEATLDQPLADALTRGQALRFGALCHDLGKPATEQVDEDGRIFFMGHDRLGVELVAEVFKRLRVSRSLTSYVQGLTLHHLRLGFLLREKPLGDRAIYRYITTCEPVALEVTVLSVADRLATRGERVRDEVIEAHLDLGREMAGRVLAWRESGPPKPLVHGDELAGELGLEPGPEIGGLLNEIAEAQYAGEVSTLDEALALARRMVSS